MLFDWIRLVGSLSPLRGQSITFDWIGISFLIPPIRVDGYFAETALVNDPQWFNWVGSINVRQFVVDTKIKVERNKWQSFQFIFHRSTIRMKIGSFFTQIHWKCHWNVVKFNPINLDQWHKWRAFEFHPTSNSTQRTNWMKMEKLESVSRHLNLSSTFINFGISF